MSIMGGGVDFKSYEQDQGQLFRSHLSEALDAGDSVFFIDDFVEGMELSAFEGGYAVRCQYSAEHLSSSPIVVEKASEPFKMLDVSAHIRLAAPIVDQCIVDSLMIPLEVVVLRVLPHGVA
jgi:hypothetical protein